LVAASGGDTDTDLPAVRSLYAGQFIGKLSVQRYDFPGIGYIDFSGRGQMAPVIFEKANVELLFEIANISAQRRLGNIKSFRRLGIGTAVNNRRDISEVFDVHRSTAISSADDLLFCYYIFFT
jgi:hypothetical protein